MHFGLSDDYRSDYRNENFYQWQRHDRNQTSRARISRFLQRITANGARRSEAQFTTSALGRFQTRLKRNIFESANTCKPDDYRQRLANLPKSAIQGNWLQFPRVKTGIDRRIPLWPETVQALKEAIERRPVAKDPAESGLCFITKYGHRWVRHGPSGTSNVDKIIDAFNKLLTDLNLKRDRIGFYALRHTFETIAGGCGDQMAVSAIMGHTDDSMASLYREKIDDARLLKAVSHVRAWLFPVISKAPAKRKPSKRKEEKKDKPASAEQNRNT